MKKWYAIIGVLVLALVVSISQCGSNSAEVDKLKGELADVKTELTNSRAELDELQDEYEKLGEEYAVLKGAKEMVFGKGIRLFDIHWKPGYWGILEGEVQNVSGEPMQRVEIIVANYAQDGSLKGVDSTIVSDLFVKETAEWSISGIFLEDGSLYEREPEEILAIYAFGNR